MSARGVAETPTVYEALTAYARRSCEPPNAAGVRAEQPLTLACRCAERDCLRGCNPGGKRRGKRTDRPVAAPDNPIPSKALDFIFDVRTKVIDRPSSSPGIGHDTGNLDPDIRTSCDLRDALAAGMLGAVLDRGHAAMVKDELDLGLEIGERGRIVDLVRPHTKVERQRCSGEPLDVGPKRRAFAQVVGDDVQHAAEPLDEWICEVTLEKGRKIFILWPTRAGGAPREARGPARKALDSLSFELDVVGSDVALHVGSVRDATTLRLQAVGFIGRVAIEHRDPREPRIA